MTMQGNVPPVVQSVLGQQNYPQFQDASNQDILRYFQQKNPMALYEVMLLDYLGRQIAIRGDKSSGAGMSLQEANDIYDKSKSYMTYKMPLQSLPEFDKLNWDNPNFIFPGQNTQSIIDAFRTQTQNQYAVALAKGKLQQKTVTSLIAGAGTPAGRTRLEGAITRGDIDPKLAQQVTDYYDQVDAQKEAEKAYQAQIKEQTGQVEAVQKERTGTYQKAQQAMQNPRTEEVRSLLNQAVNMGILDKNAAFGPNSAWSKWQNQQATAESQKALGGNLPPNSMGAALQKQGQAAQTQANTQANLLKQSQWLSVQYPELYKQWSQDFLKGYGLGTGNIRSTAAAASAPNNPMWGAPASQFSPGGGFTGPTSGPVPGWQVGFAQEAQVEGSPLYKAIQQADVQGTKDYGSAYGAYKNYLNTADEFKPIQTWLNENPLAQDAVTKYQSGQKTRSIQAVYR